MITIIDQQKTECIIRGIKQKRLAFAMASHPRCFSQVVKIDKHPKTKNLSLLASNSDLMRYIFFLVETSLLVNLQRIHIHIQKVFKYKLRHGIKCAYQSLFSKIFLHQNHHYHYHYHYHYGSPLLSKNTDRPNIRKTAMDAIVKIVSSMMLLLPPKVATLFLWDNEALFLHNEECTFLLPIITTHELVKIEDTICHSPMKKLLFVLFKHALDSESLHTHLLKAAYHRRWNFPLLTLKKHKEWDSHVRFLIIQWGHQLVHLNP